MIEGVTFQGQSKFTAGRYAMEIRSRFANQDDANGYYKGRGEELAAKIIGTSIQLGTGLFLVQGRMMEVTSTETVEPKITAGYEGYIVVRLETFHASDEQNVSIVAYTAASLDDISLEQDDIYSAEADEENLVYEYPLYSFKINSSGSLTSLTKLIEPIQEFEDMQEKVDSANDTANQSLEQSGEAISDVADLRKRIVESEGTAIYVNENPIAEMDFDGIETEDSIILYLDGGTAED